MGKILNIIDRTIAGLETVLIAVFSIVALALGVVQVVLRYVFNTGYTWSEALFVLMTIAAMLVAGSRAVREDKHVSVDLVPRLLPDGPRLALRILSHVAALLLSACFAYCGFLYVQFAHMMGTASPDTGIPDWITYSLVPVTMAAFAVRYVIRIVLAAQGRDVWHGLSEGDASTLGDRS